jgi:hypothetical protein
MMSFLWGAGFLAFHFHIVLGEVYMDHALLFLYQTTTHIFSFALNFWVDD